MSRVITVVAVLAAMAAIPTPTMAQDAAVPLGGYWLFYVRCDAGGYTAQQRASIIAGRAAELLSLGDPSKLDIRIARVGTQANIYAGGKLFATVNPCDARANGTTVMRLARVWAEQLRQTYPKALPRPPEVGVPESEGGRGAAAPAPAPRRPL